jgi:hypothetical protein
LVFLSQIIDMDFKANDRFKLKEGVRLQPNSNIEALKGKVLILSFCVDIDAQVYKFSIEGEGPELYAVFAGDLEPA